jgi:hypothetical protein
MSASPYAAEICAKTTADVKTWAYIGWVAATSTDPLAANHYGCACWTQLAAHSSGAPLLAHRAAHVMGLNACATTPGT